MDHCFISYSTADGLEFTRRLADELESSDPQLIAWYDKRDIPPGAEWDEQIVEAIKTCKCMLFVMSDDSTKPSSDCKNEIVFALRYKKPIIPLLLNKKVEPLLVLGTREWIDFTGNFNKGMPRVRKSIRELDLPEGNLRALKERLADAEHDLRRATDEEENRIKGEIAELKKQIETQQEIVDNPEAAEDQTRKNIEAGLERERQPEKPMSKATSTKFINPPPGIAPNYFQDRFVETQQVAKFLRDDAQRLMTVVGRGGVGKTAMVCRLLRGLETGELPDGLGAMKTEGIVYLSESGSHRVNFANIFYDLCKLLPAETANELDAVYKSPHGSTEGKMHAVLEKFTDGRVVLMLDNFEPLVDTETFAIRDAELDEALRAFLNGMHTAVNIIITTRAAPRALNLIQPGRQRVLILDGGLESPYAENILREMDNDESVGLKSAPADLLGRARERTRGYPRALEALFAILASDRYTTLEELLAMPTPENVVEALVGEAFNRLDGNAQKVMQALAIYNRPVTSAAVDYLLAPHLPAIDSVPILHRLANMHFARKEGGRYYLHPMDRGFAFSLIPDFPAADMNDATRGTSKKPTSLASPQSRYFAQHDLTLRAADYFAQARKPRAEWKTMYDIAAQLAEFDLRCAAGDYEAAVVVLNEIAFNYMLLWGHYRLLIGAYLRVKDKLQEKYLVMHVLNNLGLAYWDMGLLGESVSCLEAGLSIAVEKNDRDFEATFLGNLGNTFTALGYWHKAMEYYEKDLAISRELGRRTGEGTSLGNIGITLFWLGDVQKAIGYFEQALAIHRETHDRYGESRHLGNLGEAYLALDEVDRAIEFVQQAQTIRREMGNKLGEVAGLGNLGDAFVNLGNIEQASLKFQQAIEMADQIEFRHGQIDMRCKLTRALLFRGDLVSAKRVIESALQFDVPEVNHSANVLYGFIVLRQGEASAARQALARAVAQANEILAKTPDYFDALDVKALASSGLAICDDKKYIADAIETFRTARKIAPHAGVVKSVLWLFDELVKCDEEGVLKVVRKAAEGKE